MATANGDLSHWPAFATREPRPTRPDDAAIDAACLTLATEDGWTPEQIARRAAYIRARYADTPKVRARVTALLIPTET
jgi:hypothetical protein